MTRHFRHGIGAVGLLALLIAATPRPAGAVQAVERLAGPIPEILNTQSAGSDGRHPSPLWVDDLRHAVVLSQESYPRSDFAPYLDKLDRVQEAMEDADRSTVRAEMIAFFSMLAKQDNGIEHEAATEVRKMAQMLTPFDEYWIIVPRASGGQPSTDVPRSRSSK